jgi:hypothetical protein
LGVQEEIQASFKKRWWWVDSREGNPKKPSFKKESTNPFTSGNSVQWVGGPQAFIITSFKSQETKIYKIL